MNLKNTSTHFTEGVLSLNHTLQTLHQNRASFATSDISSFITSSQDSSISIPKHDSKGFLKTLRETLIAFSFNSGGILAGLIFASLINVFQSYQWVIALYPAVLSARGVVSGLFSSRLGTALHLGLIYPRFFGNTKSFYKLFEAIILLTLETSIITSIISIVFTSLLWRVTITAFIDVFLVIIGTMTLGLPLSLLTVIVAFTTFRRGLDPDVIQYPIMSAFSDIFITICYAVTLILYLTSRGIPVFTVGIHFILAFYILLRNRNNREFRRTIKESFLTLIFVAFIVNITGTVLNRIILEGSNEIYTVYPALIATIGSVGSVVGSTATTKLALGLLPSSFSSIKTHIEQISNAWIASVMMFIFYSALSLFINGTLTLPSLIGFTLILLVTNSLAVLAIITISFAVSIITFQKGLDPDNFVIPIESAIADTITSIALFISFLLLG